jgi:hypothetical protein
LFLDLTEISKIVEHLLYGSGFPQELLLPLYLILFDESLKISKAARKFYLSTKSPLLRITMPINYFEKDYYLQLTDIPPSINYTQGVVVMNEDQKRMWFENNSLMNESPLPKFEREVVP